ncbi:MAG: hypothetical protein LUH40_05715 [Clostridiales bacterium]|nr:hypothetical protein [Clostridiales bacterium]
MNDTAMMRSFVIKLNKKTIAPIAVLAVIVVLVVIFSAAGVSEKKSEVNLFYSPEENGAVFFEDDKISSDVIPAASVSVVKYSEDKSSCCILAAVGSSYNLYYVKNGEYTLICEGAANRFAIDYTGSTAIFYDNSGTLKRYTASGGKIREIASGSDKFAVSPDGESIIYNVNESGTDTLYLYRNGSSTEIGTGYTPVAVSDSCKYIYVIGNSDNSLCVLDSGGSMKSKLCTDISAGTVMFSEDIKTVVFSDGEYTYMSDEGKSRVRFCEGQASPVVNESFSVTCDSENTARIYSSENLCDMYYSVSNNDGTSVLFYIDKNGERTDIDEMAENMIVTDKNEIIFLNSGGTVCSFSKGSLSELVSGAADVRCTADGKYIYYLNSSDELYALKKGESVKIAAGVEKFYVTNKDILLFIMQNGDLYASEKQEYGELIDSNVYSCLCTGNAAFYYKDYSVNTGYFDLYSSDGSENFTLSAEKISWIM